MKGDPKYPKPEFLKFAGRRKGRPLREGREEAFNAVTDQFAVPVPATDVKTDPRDYFPNRPEKLWLEIGFGNGEHLIGQAMRHPEIGFIGCEPFINGVSAASKDVVRNDLKNIRFWSDDAMALLPHLKPESFDRIFLLFSDPWPKKRQHKRRVIQPNTVSLFASLLRKGGELRLATDHPDLAEWMLIHVNDSKLFKRLPDETADWSAIPSDWIETRYQQKAALQGRLPFFMDFAKI